ncbi:hypothetical protein F66182_17440 [Fusarium sp. NRRL 66182]|nr:hypothetical protein F66182_17440 [Fusarium sp. NRRL 66182]
MDWGRYIAGFQKWSDAEHQSHFFFQIQIPDDQSVSSQPFDTSETSSVIHTTFAVCGWTQRLSQLRTEYFSPIRPGDTLTITVCSVESSEDRIRVALAISNKQGHSVATAEAMFEVLPKSCTMSPLREDCFLYDMEKDKYKDEYLEPADVYMYNGEQDEWEYGHTWLD